MVFLSQGLTPLANDCRPAGAAGLLSGAADDAPVPHSARANSQSAIRNPRFAIETVWLRPKAALSKIWLFALSPGMIVVPRAFRPDDTDAFPAAPRAAREPI